MCSLFSILQITMIPGAFGRRKSISWNHWTVELGSGEGWTAVRYSVAQYLSSQEAMVAGDNSPSNAGGLLGTFGVPQGCFHALHLASALCTYMYAIRVPECL